MRRLALAPPRAPFATRRLSPPAWPPRAAVAVATPQPTTSWRPNSSSSSAAAAPQASQEDEDAARAARRLTPPGSAAGATYRRVGNVFVVRCVDHLFKHGPEVNAALRTLRFEFKGQTTIHPDIPEVRKALFVARHCVTIDAIDLDEAKEIVGIPAHMEFRDLARQIPPGTWRVKSQASPLMASKVQFTEQRRARLRDIFDRDAVELKLLKKKKQLRSAAQQTTTAAATGGSQASSRAPSS